MLPTILGIVLVLSLLALFIGLPLLMWHLDVVPTMPTEEVRRALTIEEFAKEPLTVEEMEQINEYRERKKDILFVT
jgi:hypothetical protein